MTLWMLLVVMGLAESFGGIMTGIFADPAVNHQNWVALWWNRIVHAQIISIVFTILFAGGISFLLIHVIKRVLPIRVTEQEEAIGMDRSEHDETAYPTFMGWIHRWRNADEKSRSDHSTRKIRRIKGSS